MLFLSPGFGLGYTMGYQPAMRSNSLPSMSRNVSHRAPFWHLIDLHRAQREQPRRLGVEIAGNQVEVKAVFAGFRLRNAVEPQAGLNSAAQDRVRVVSAALVAP